MARGNRKIPSNPTGQQNKPRLKGNSSTTNIGKGTKSSAAKQDSNAFKRGDEQASRASNFLTDSSKAHRSSSKLSKMPPSLPSKFNRGD